MLSTGKTDRKGVEKKGIWRGMGDYSLGVEKEVVSKILWKEGEKNGEKREVKGREKHVE